MLQSAKASNPDDDEIAEPPRDPFFNPFRVPKGDNVRPIIADVLREVQNYEKHFAARKRVRKPADQARFERIVSGVICDLIHRDLMDQQQALAISLSKAVWTRSGRYGSPVLSKTLPEVLERLAAPEMAFVEVQKGQKRNDFRRGRRTTIIAGERLLTRIGKYEVELADLRQDLDQETVILKKTRSDHGKTGDRINYTETGVASQYRAAMRDINAWLDDAPITWDNRVYPEWVVDPGDRLLRRYFNNGSFEEGGRLFGGFWQPLKKAHRADGIRIDAEPVVTLDYAQMAPRILYAMAGVSPPAGDLYRIPTINEVFRDGIKKVFSAMQFVEGDLSRRPKGTGKLLPRGPIRMFTDAIRDHHRPIAHMLDGLIGHKVFFRESQIMVDLLLRLRKLAIVALPIHDAVIVPRSAEQTAEATMLQVFRDHLGFDGVVEVEGSLIPSTPVGVAPA